MFHFQVRMKKSFLMAGMMIAALMSGVFSTASAETSPSNSAVHKTSMAHQDSPGWAEKLKGQTIVENSVEGRSERAALVEPPASTYDGTDGKGRGASRRQYWRI